MSNFENINNGGKIAIKLEKDDKLIGVQLAKSTDNILLVSKYGMATRFAVNDLRITKGRSSDGVRGMRLNENDEVVSMCILSGNENDSSLKEQFLSLDKNLRLEISEKGINDLEIQAKLNDFINKYKKEGKEWNLTIEQVKKMVDEEQFLLTVASDGYGKRTSAYEYRITGRGGKGISNINLQSKAYVVATLLADNKSDIMMIGTKGKAIRTPAEKISLIGRKTKGVKVFDLDECGEVASVSSVYREDTNSDD